MQKLSNRIFLPRCDPPILRQHRLFSLPVYLERVCKGIYLKDGKDFLFRLSAQRVHAMSPRQTSLNAATTLCKQGGNGIPSHPPLLGFFRCEDGVTSPFMWPFSRMSSSALDHWAGTFPTTHRHDERRPTQVFPKDGSP